MFTRKREKHAGKEWTHISGDFFLPIKITYTLYFNPFNSSQKLEPLGSLHPPKHPRLARFIYSLLEILSFAATLKVNMFDLFNFIL